MRGVINEAREYLCALCPLLGGRFTDLGLITITPATKVTTISSTKNELTLSQAPTALATTSDAPPDHPIAPGQSELERTPLHINKRVLLKCPN